MKDTIGDYLNSYVFDIYIDSPPRNKVWLIDINPWIPECTDSLLFEWKEILEICGK
jgi:hypothetical protein